MGCMYPLCSFLGECGLVLTSATALALRLPRWTDDHPASLVELVRFLSWLYCGSEDYAMLMLLAIPTFQQPHHGPDGPYLGLQR